jgi:hypothetical protein
LLMVAGTPGNTIVNTMKLGKWLKQKATQP